MEDINNQEKAQREAGMGDDPYVLREDEDITLIGAIHLSQVRKLTVKLMRNQRNPKESLTMRGSMMISQKVTVLQRRCPLECRVGPGRRVHKKG